MKTCAHIIAEYLKANKFDGLYTSDCGCLLEDLMPCGGDYAMTCSPGYKIDGCTEWCGLGCGFHVGPRPKE